LFIIRLVKFSLWFMPPDDAHIISQIRLVTGDN